MKKKMRYYSRVNMLLIAAFVVFILFFLSCREMWIEKTVSVPALYRQLPYNGIPYGGFCAVIMFFVFACVFGGAARYRSVNYLFRLMVFIVPVATLLPLFTETLFFMRHHVFSNVIEVAVAIVAPGWWVSLCLAFGFVGIMEVILCLERRIKPEKH